LKLRSSLRAIITSKPPCGLYFQPRYFQIIKISPEMLYFLF
jgi:hypothetical protein